MHAIAIHGGAGVIPREELGADETPARMWMAPGTAAVSGIGAR